MTAQQQADNFKVAGNSQDIVLHARNVTLTLGSDDAPVEILKGIDLDIARGESLAILGASGSGKSSMMALLTGLERATGGQIILAGQDIGGMDEDALAQTRRGRVGIILQAFHLLPTMTALENVMVPLELSQGKDIRGRAKDALEKVGLGHRIGHYPAQLSGGEQQRVAIARALANAPALVLADEPTGNLDPDNARLAMDLLQQLCRRHDSALLAVSHDRELLSGFDRQVELAELNRVTRRTSAS